MRRILVIGSSGSGKSVLATRLGDILKLPVIHLDRLFWNPGWVACPRSEMDEKVAAACRGESWIIDGNYGRTLPQRLEACDTIVFLDFPRWACLLGAARRYWRYRGRTRPDMGPGCTERLSWEFIQWIWSFPKRGRPEVLKSLHAVELQKPVVVLRSRSEVEGFVRRCQGLRQNTTPAGAR